MQAENNNARDMVWELQNLISRLPLHVCCTTVLPEFGVRWTEVAGAVRNHRLPMESASIARVLCRYIAKSIPGDELHDILARLKLHLVTRQSRTWHVIHLQEQLAELLAPHDVAPRVHAELHHHKAHNTTQVHWTMVDSLLYLSIHVLGKQSPLYVACPLTEPVALVSTLGAKKLLQAVAQGIGYSRYSSARLHGPHIPSLLRMASPAWVCAPHHLVTPPPYAPAPQRAPSGLTYTNQEYDAHYVDQILGPDPPLLTSLSIKSTTDFFDKSLLNKSINLSLNLKSSSVATSLKTWVVKGAIAPNSEFINTFHKIKANRITMAEDNDGVSE